MEFDVMPCYVAYDLSFSMSDHLDELNAGLREFRGAVHADPSVAARIGVCLVGFAESARELRALCPADELPELFAPMSCAGTDFGRAFTFLREIIDRDVCGLKAHRLRVHRPVVFFASDGRPTDPATWPAAFDALVDPAWAARPNVVAYGLGAVDQHTLNRIGRFRVFSWRDGVRIGTALTASVAWTALRPDHV
ncbi:vWA domain-containing protein [Goodfellowiella coeruleoviolacea]|uniref:Conserved protein YegL, contains vWA domain of TerY type n=1 Tax=Goodfellowiella coeruleoviolacea TaxID=334858 RepID=A0AAE3GFF2_9PSEU|nr:hypothetical protein [Goodfellowiella coeruleoviolacea]MCP2167252.1 putative conserved protein YegL, contains vWA domain of TerY type [Goodfellowiella coeruleoviolacea]